MSNTSESIIKRIIENIQNGKYCENDVNELTNTILRNQLCNSLYEQLIQPKVLKNEYEEVNMISKLEASLNYYSLVSQYVSSPFKKSGFIESWENRILCYICEKPDRVMLNFSEIIETALNDNEKFIAKLLESILKNEPESSDYISDVINSFDSHFQLYIKSFNSLFLSYCNNRSDLFKLLNLELRIFRYVSHYNQNCVEIREFIANHINLMNSLSEQQQQQQQSNKESKDKETKNENSKIATNYQLYQILLSVFVLLLPIVPDMLEEHNDMILDAIIKICSLFSPIDRYDICCSCRYIILSLYSVNPIKIHEYLINNNLSNKLSFMLFGNVSFNYLQLDFSFNNSVKSPSNNTNSLSLNELRHFIFELSLSPLKLQLNGIYENSNVDKNYSKCINTFNTFIKSFPLIEEYTNKDVLPDDLLSIPPPVFNFCNYIGDVKKNDRNENEVHYYEELFNEIQNEHKEYVEILTKKSMEIDNEMKKVRESSKYNNFTENEEYAKKIQHYQQQIALLNSKLSEYEEINIEKLKEENKCYKEALTQWEVYNKNYIEDSIDSLYNKANSDIERLELRISELEKQNEILNLTITEMKKYPNKDGEKDNNQEIVSLQDQYSKLQFTLDETIEQYESHLDDMRKELELKDKELAQLGSKYGC